MAYSDNLRNRVETTGYAILSINTIGKKFFKKFSRRSVFCYFSIRQLAVSYKKGFANLVARRAELWLTPPSQSHPRLHFVVHRQRLCRRRADSLSVGEERIELSTPHPQRGMLPLYHSPNLWYFNTSYLHFLT